MYNKKRVCYPLACKISKWPYPSIILVVIERNTESEKGTVQIMNCIIVFTGQKGKKIIRPNTVQPSPYSVASLVKHNVHAYNIKVNNIN